MEKYNKSYLRALIRELVNIHNLNLTSIRKLRGRDRTREIARIRDNYICQNCGRKWSKKERRFDVHHLNGCGVLTRKYDKIIDLNNLITYCHKCHLNLESVKRKMVLAYKKIKL